jgi:hypothetical protein
MLDVLVVQLTSRSRSNATESQVTNYKRTLVMYSVARRLHTQS